MLVFDISDFTKNATDICNTALSDEVIINNKDGNSFKLLPITNKEKSPFDNIPRVKLDVTTQGIVEIINECRAGAP